MPSKKTSRKQSRKAVEYVNCLWSLICSMSSIDQQKNNISLFNVISQVNVPKGQFVEGHEIFAQIQHELVVVFRRAVSTKLCTDRLVVDTAISLIDPNGKILSELFTPISFEPGKRIMRFRFQLPGFKLTVPGDYVYKVEVKQPNGETPEKINEVPFEVIEVDQKQIA